MANYSAPQYKGHSVAFDGMAFGEFGSRDTLVVEAGGAKGIYLTTFNMEALRYHRSTETWGDAYRKRAAYNGLTHGPMDSTFTRKDSRR